MRSLLLALHASEAISKASNYDQPGDAANMLQVEFFNRADLPSSDEIPCAEPGEEANMLQVGAYAVHGEQAEEEGKHQPEHQVPQPWAQNQPTGNPPAQQQPLVEHPPTSTQATELDLNELIALNGVFRGMRVSKDVDSNRRNTVLEFGSSLPSASQMLLNPDDSASETSFQSKDHQRVKNYDKYVSTYGYKSAYEHSYTRTHSYFRPPRWWWWGHHSSNNNYEWEYSGDYEYDRDYEWERETDTTTKTWTKVKYYVEPTAELVIDNSVLQPVASFVHAVDNIPDDGDKNQAIDHIFDAYGSHVCTHVMFGGWWRIEANVQSTTEVTTTEMDYTASNSISRTWKSSYDYGWRWNSWWWGGHSNQYSNKHESDWGWDSEYERSSQDTSSGVTVVVDTKQEWKGGESGAGAQQWRDSLRVGKKNWKVIERFPDDCLPVWNWVEDSSKKSAMCNRWKTTLGADMGFNDHEFANLCSETPDGSLELLLGIMEEASSNRCGHLEGKGVAGVTTNRAVPVSVAQTDDQCSQKCTSDSQCVAWVREAETNTCWTPREGNLAAVRFMVEEGKTSGLRCAQ